MTAYPVNRLGGDPRNDDEACIAPGGRGYGSRAGEYERARGGLALAVDDDAAHADATARRRAVSVTGIEPGGRNADAARDMGAVVRRDHVARGRQLDTVRPAAALDLVADSISHQEQNAVPDKFEASK